MAVTDVEILSRTSANTSQIETTQHVFRYASFQLNVFLM